MVQPTLDVLDRNGGSKTVFTQNPNGQALENDSQPVAIASDQSAIPVSFPGLVQPVNGINTLSAAGSVAAQIVPGGTYFLCVSQLTTLGAGTNTLASCTTTVGSTTVAYTGASPQIGQLVAGTGIVVGSYVTAVSAGVNFTISLPANAAGTNTLNVTAGFFTAVVETSPDSATWTGVSVVPRGYLFNSLATASIVAPGLYRYTASASEKYVRVRVVTIGLTGVVTNATSHAVRINIDAGEKEGGSVNLPYVAYIAATAASFPTGIPILMPVDMSGLAYASFNIQALTGTSQTVTWRQSNDDTGALFTGLPHLTNQQAQNAAAVTTNGAGEFILGCSARYLSAVFSAGTAISVCSISGVIGTIGAALPMSQVVNTINNQPINIVQAGSNPVISGAQQGSTNFALGVSVGGANNSTLTTTAFAGNGATNGATQAFAQGGGTTMAFDVSVTTLTLGTATSVLFSIDESYDNGTTYSSIWTTDPVTATGHVRVPPLFITGRVRLRAWSVGGTSTTVTVATNVMASGAGAAITRQMVDVFAATNPFTSVINGTNFASTLVSTTLNSVSAVALVEGCKVLTVGGVFTGGTPTTAPVYSLQISQDGTNWFTTTTTFSPTAAGTFMGTLNGVSARFARLTVTTASAGGTAYTVSKTFINGTN